MKSLIAILCLGFLFAAPALAQTTTPTASVVLNYTMPSQALNTATGQLEPIPATGPNSLAKVQIWLSRTPWATGVDVSGTPTVETTPGTTTTTTFSASVGDTVYARLKVCNVAGVCGDTSNQASGLVKASKPGAPTLNTVIINLN